MPYDPDDPIVRQIKAQFKADPRLSNPSAYIRAFAAALNDRQPDAEKNTPETEWRRMRDLWGALGLLGKGLVALTSDLEKNALVGVEIHDTLGAIAEPTDSPYDPISGSEVRAGNGGGIPGNNYGPQGGLSHAIRLIRLGISKAREVAELACSGAATDHGALLGLGDDDHLQYLLEDGTRAMSGALDMGSNPIENVDDPTNAQDAATKAYVDTADGLFIKKDGSVAFTGDQSMGGNQLTNVGAPGAGGEATNKTYVDAGDALAIAKSTLTAKGDIITASAAGTPAIQAVGANGTTLIADSGQADGWKTGDHGDLGGLSDDDHTQYTKADGTRAFTGNQSMGSNKITSLANGTGANDAVNKSQLDAVNGLPPGTGKGDIAVYNGSAWVVLTVGTNGQSLLADSTTATGLRWGTP